MNRHKIRVFLWVLLLTVCAVLMGSCIHPVPGDYHTSDPDTTPSLPDVTISTTPEDTPPEDEKPAQTTTTTTEDTTKEPTTETTGTTAPQETTTQETTTQETTTKQEENIPQPKKIKIYIDQGHNPFSPTHPPSWNTGASNEALGLYEQDLTYEIGILLAELLTEDERFEVRLSRPTAETILGTYNGSVSEANESAKAARVEDAEKWGADYFVSLHINASSEYPTATGIEVYYLDETDEGYALGNQILDALIESTKLRNRGMKSGSQLYVLKNATMPATLLEMGFITNEGDAKLLDESPELFAQGIFNGIQAYFDAIEEDETPTETTTE